MKELNGDTIGGVEIGLEARRENNRVIPITEKYQQGNTEKQKVENGCRDNLDQVRMV